MRCVHRQGKRPIFPVNHDALATAKPLRFAWFSKHYCDSKASTRLRLLLPIAQLSNRGVRAERYDPARVADYSAIVICKSFGAGAAKVAAAARAASVPIIVDICDNVIERATRHGLPKRASAIRAQLAQAALITVPTAVLGDQLTEGDPALARKIRIVPDMLEAPPVTRLSALDRFRLWRLRRFTAAHPKRLHCVWFGWCSDASGLIHLDAALADRRLGGQRDDITITVISNDRGCYQALSRHWHVPHHYVPWKRASFLAALRCHRVALIPVDRNPSTVGKTVNRPATAILAGLGVVADAIGSYEQLAPFVYLDDWSEGLRRYAGRWDEEAHRLADARDHLERHYCADAVTGAWKRALVEAAGVGAMVDAGAVCPP